MEPAAGMEGVVRLAAQDRLGRPDGAPRHSRARLVHPHERWVVAGADPRFGRAIGIEREAPHDADVARAVDALQAIRGDRGVRTAAVGRAFVAAHEPGRLQAVDAAGHAAPAQQDVVGELAHPQLAAGGRCKVHQHVVVGEGDQPLGLELCLQAAHDGRVGAEEGPPRPDPGAAQVDLQRGWRSGEGVGHSVIPRSVVARRR